MSDPRTYVDKMFFDLIDGKMVPKRARTVDCYSGVPELPTDQIMILERYKQGKQRGRKDKLEGKTVVVIPTGGKPLKIPLNEGLKMSRHMHSYFTALARVYTPTEVEVEEVEQ